jgi:undecaprenyl-diphosphatase
MALDLTVTRWLESLAPHLSWLWIFLAQDIAYVLGALLLFMIVREKRVMHRAFFAAFAALQLLVARGILTESFYFFLPRQRPFAALGFEPLVAHAASPAFPSGHTVFMASVACVLLMVDRKWAKIAFALAALSGIARVIVGVHWAGDILGGFVLALGAYALLRFLVRRYARDLESVQVEEGEVPQQP